MRAVLLAVVLAVLFSGSGRAVERASIGGTVLGASKSAYEVYAIDVPASPAMAPRVVCVCWRKGKRLGEYVVVWAGPRYSLIVPRKGSRAVLQPGDQVRIGGRLALPPARSPFVPSRETVWVKERENRLTDASPAWPTWTAPGWNAPTWSGPQFSLPGWSAPSHSAPTYGAPTWSLPGPSMPSWSGPSWTPPSWSLPSVDTATGP
jgi:hypothetical protein